MADPAVRPADKAFKLEDFRKAGVPVTELHIDRAIHRLGSRLTVNTNVDPAEMELHPAGVLVQYRQNGGGWAVVLVPWNNILDCTLAATTSPTATPGVRLR